MGPVSKGFSKGHERMAVGCVIREGIDELPCLFLNFPITKVPGCKLQHFTAPAILLLVSGSFFTLPSPPVLLTQPPVLHYLGLALIDPMIGFVSIKAALSHTSYCPGLQQASPCRANAAQTLLLILLDSNYLFISLLILPMKCIP